MNKNLLNIMTLVLLAILTLTTLVSSSVISSTGNAAVYNSAPKATDIPPESGKVNNNNGSSSTPTPAATTEPTPGQTAAPAPTPTITPTSTPKPSSTPTSTPKPSSTSKPSSSPPLTPKPSSTSKPSSTPTPIPTPTPSPTPVPAPAGKVVVGYYGGWAAYSGYTPDKIPASSLTHLDYAFAKIGSDMKIALGDTSIDPGNLTALIKLKSANPNLKILISVGGWNDSGRFSDASFSDTNRTVFADSVVDFILKYHLDGVDLDWEYPVSGGISSNISRTEDKQNFTLLLSKVREKLDVQGKKDGKHYWLTIAGSSGSYYARNTELGKISKYLDYALVMTYDIHGIWDSYTDFNAPLYTPTESSPQARLSADSAIKMYISAGFPASKLVTGIPFYGYVYTGVTNANNGLYQHFTSSANASYDSIQSKYAANPAYKEYTSSADSPWLFDGSTYISYDNEATIALKTDYVKSHDLAGAGVWELSQNKNGTLLKSIYKALR